MNNWLLTIHDDNNVAAEYLPLNYRLNVYLDNVIAATLDEIKDFDVEVEDAAIEQVYTRMGLDNSLYIGYASGETLEVRARDNGLLITLSDVDGQEIGTWTVDSEEAK